MKSKLFLPDEVMDERIEDIIEGRPEKIVVPEGEGILFNYFTPTLHEIRNSNLPDEKLYSVAMFAEDSDVDYTITYFFGESSGVEVFQRDFSVNLFSDVMGLVYDYHDVPKGSGWMSSFEYGGDTISDFLDFPYDLDREEFIDVYQSFYSNWFDKAPFFHYICYKDLDTLERSYSNLKRLVITDNS